MKIGVYVNTKHAKSNYKTECFNVRLFAGVEVVKDVLIKNGHDVGYCSEFNVNKFDIILVSITAQCDWYQFVGERERWPHGSYKVIIGGAGMLNVRPFLKWFDVCIWGRAESVISEVVDNIDSCHGMAGCVAESKKFNPNEIYRIKQAACLYPDIIKIGDHIQSKSSSGAKNQ